VSELQIDDSSPVADEQGQVVRWRIERLLAAGYDGMTALLIGVDFTIDLHVAVALVGAGCPPGTAARILL
jgi:hypothetical protein